MISVENVVSEQLPPAVSKYAFIRKMVVAFLRFLFHESEFKSFEEKYPHLKGFDFIDQVLDHFDFQYSVSDRERECIPAEGPVVIISNHPIGSLDGLALLKMVSEVRRDVKAVANELLMSLPPLENVLLPVDNMGNRTAKDNIRAIDRHLQCGGAMIIFPAGEVSRVGPTGVKDGKWHNGFIKFAKKAKAPILPVFIDGRNSVFFYSVSLLAKPLSTLLLINEMFKQVKSSIPIRIGPAIPYEVYTGLPLKKKSVTKLFKRHVYKLGKNKVEPFFEVNARTIAHPESRVELRQELRACERLGETGDGKQIYLFNYSGDSVVMREVGRLREISFRAVGEGSGLRRDIDAYDSYYDHIILWDDDDLEIVGAYRLVRAAEALQQGDMRKDDCPLYSQTLFHYTNIKSDTFKQGVELGRSFVQPKYWGKRSLDYLWYGIGAYLNKYPQMRYLFGPVSISNSYPDLAKQTLVAFYRAHFPSQPPFAVARQPFAVAPQVLERFRGEDYSAEFTRLKSELTALDVKVPTLYKQYTEICEAGGVQFADFNVDPDFADCIDGLVLVDIEYLKPKKRKRYLGK
ncbi:MAG: lysophospholipid acyltransferase family protein [Candidatus Pelagadaptatus aseana]|uniref:GNAT family N-acyltransferase n=1 Tax=Candidatus Pelagadaptatus aseana TaxID=3120508 RepID=UPI0039B29993